MASPPDLEQRVDGARLGVVSATRALIERVAGIVPGADETALAQATAAIEMATAALAATGGGRDGEADGEGSGATTPHASPARRYADFLPRSLLVGQAHPLSPAATYAVTDGVLEVRVRFGSAYEGPPGCVHGGVIALAFDELFGMTNVVHGRGGLTGRLSVRYRTPTPLHRELALRAWPFHQEGRRMRLRGTLHAGPVLTAEAEGLFVVPRPGVPVRPAAEA